MQLTVTATSRVSPDLVRVEFSGDLASFAESTFTDRYVKLQFPDAVRTYTALDPDVEAGTVAVEFVVHGDTGVAGPWAAAAQPGDVLEVRGPGGAYAPDPAADWHLLVGDESALPAIRAALQALPAEATARAYVEIEGPGHEAELPREVTWVHRGSGAAAAMAAAEQTEPALLTAVREGEWLPGRVQCFVHGEAQVVMHALRPFLLAEKGLPREDVSVSGYWRRGRTEEGFRDWKRELREAEGA
ncbi:siderophore-interacting protein [Nocardioides mangrovicus]|uniref:Siderophore-interacting protein n=1 Tax=Nocardioides mangrovicus TaxID=2478913 RepID=A0A3L8P357_9ACTN|nr:siderophore-interacting protein [Nocardioides mangrovicus]RLV48868.1 siderophore-interacting protein [Nocardioides mangrovicus]